MSYTVNGVSLNDKTRGWKLLRGSIPASSLEYAAASLDIPGRDGSTTYPAVRRPVSFTFTVRSKLQTREGLLSLFSAPQITIAPEETPKKHYRATGYLLSSTVDEYHEALGFAIDTFIVEIPGGCWRNSSQTTSNKVTSSSAGATLTFLDGISAPVQDGVVRLEGPLTDPIVHDSSGSFVSVDGSIPAGSFVRFHMNPARAYLTETDAWSGGVEVTAELDFGGPRGVFEITPIVSNPTSRNAVLTLTQESRGSGSGFAVRARNAYLF